jgi:hypothetical protein
MNHATNTMCTLLEEQEAQTKNNSYLFWMLSTQVYHSDIQWPNLAKVCMRVIDLQKVIPTILDKKNEVLIPHE